MIVLRQKIKKNVGKFKRETKWTIVFYNIVFKTNNLVKKNVVDKK